jgi:hypothetical protein
MVFIQRTNEKQGSKSNKLLPLYMLWYDSTPLPGLFFFEETPLLIKSVPSDLKLSLEILLKIFILIRFEFKLNELHH